MRALLYSLLCLIFVVSCGDKNESTIQGVGASTSSYRGYSIIGASDKCSVPSPRRRCLTDPSQISAMNINFSQICETKQGKSYDCGCQEKYLCSVKLDVLVSGFNINGQSKRGIPHDDIIECPDSGKFMTGSSGKSQEEFRSRCESLGHTAILVGCSFKRYLCSSKI